MSSKPLSGVKHDDLNGHTYGNAKFVFHNRQLITEYFGLRLSTPIISAILGNKTSP